MAGGGNRFASSGVCRGGSGALSTAYVTAAINYAVAQGADIINLSLGGYTPNAAQNAPQDAIREAAAESRPRDGRVL